jgi:hypothetical protein
MTPDPNLLYTVVTVQAIAVWLLQRAKAATWIPFMQKNGGKINRVIAVAVAGIGAVGIHATFYHHALTITGLDPATVAAAVFHWAGNLVTQQVIYHGVVKNGGGAVAAAPVLAGGKQ